MADSWQAFGNQQEDEKKKQAATPEQGFSSGQQIASQVQSTLGTGGGTLRQPGSEAGSGRFTNLQKFLSANKPEKLTSSLESKFGGQASKTAQAVKAQQAQLDKQLEEQRNLQSQGQTFQKVLGGEQVEGAPKSLEELAQGDNLSKFQSFAKGETALGDLSIDEAGLSKKTRDLQALAKQAQTEKGRFGMLGSMLARPSYSGGQQKLDQLLLQRAAGGDVLKQFQQGLAEKAQTSAKGLESLKETFGKEQKTFADIEKDLAAGLQSGLSSQASTLDTDVKAQAAKIRAQQDAARIEAESMRNAIAAAQQIAAETPSSSAVMDPYESLRLITGFDTKQDAYIKERDPKLYENLEKGRALIKAKLGSDIRIGDIDPDMLYNAIQNPLALQQNIKESQVLSDKQKAQYLALQKLKGDTNLGDIASQITDATAANQIFNFTPTSEEAFRQAQQAGKRRTDDWATSIRSSGEGIANVFRQLGRGDLAEAAKQKMWATLKDPNSVAQTNEDEFARTFSSLDPTLGSASSIMPGSKGIGSMQSGWMPGGQAYEGVLNQIRAMRQARENIEAQRDLGTGLYVNPFTGQVDYNK